MFQQVLGFIAPLYTSISKMGICYGNKKFKLQTCKCFIKNDFILEKNKDILSSINTQQTCLFFLRIIMIFELHRY